jgi:hypothetical protein
MTGRDVEADAIRPRSPKPVPRPPASNGENFGLWLCIFTGFDLFPDRNQTIFAASEPPVRPGNPDGAFSHAAPPGLGIKHGFAGLNRQGSAFVMKTPLRYCISDHCPRKFEFKPDVVPQLNVISIVSYLYGNLLL